MSSVALTLYSPICSLGTQATITWRLMSEPEVFGLVNFLRRH